MQAVIAVLDEWRVVEFPWHTLQSVVGVEASEYVPIEHAWQPPLAPENLPAAHTVQIPDPVLILNFPATHAAHETPSTPV